MSNSLIIDTTELIPGALVIGETGHGRPGSAVPSSGTHGPAFAFDLVVIQVDYSGREYRGTLGAVPSSLTLKAYEDTSFTASAPTGTYIVPWSLYEDGLLVGSTTFTLVFG